MKAIMILLLSGAIAYLAWNSFLKPAPPPPPPPPPPPAILNEPAPVISPAEMEKVLKSVQDPDPSVRWEALVFLDKIKSPEAMPLLFDKLQHDQEPAVRIKIITLLSDRRRPDVLQALLGAMKDLEPDVRVAALRALDKIGDYSVAPAIALGPTRDQDEKVRLQAIKTLNSLQDKKQKEIDEARKRYEAEKKRAEAATGQGR